RMPWQIARAQRSLIIADSVIFALWPNLDPVNETVCFYKDERQRRLANALSPDAVVRSGIELIAGAGDGAAAARALRGWMTHRLPAIERDYRYGIARFERMSTRIMLSLQVAAWAGVALLSFAPKVAAEWLSGHTSAHRWVVVASLALAGLWLRRVRRELEAP